MTLSRIMSAVACAAALAGSIHGGALAQPSPGGSPADIAQVQALEQKRLAAIAAKDEAAMRTVLAPDYLHVHSNGKSDTLDSMVAAVRSAGPRRTERGPLTIRVYGDTAVITGDQTIHLLGADGQPSGAPIKMVASQVAHRDKAGWRYVLMHTTRTEAPAP